MKIISILSFVLGLIFYFFSNSIFFNEEYNKKNIFTELSTIGKFRKTKQRSQNLVEISNYIYQCVERFKFSLQFDFLHDIENQLVIYKKNIFLNNHLSIFKESINKSNGISSSNDTLTYMITLQESWEGIRKDSLDLRPYKSSIDISGGKGEWESSQVVMTPMELNVDSVNIELLDFPFNKKDIEFYWGEYVFCDRSVYKKNKSVVQDILMPLRLNETGCYTNNFYPTYIPKFESKSLWLNLFLNKDLEAGKYSFRIKVNAFSGSTQLESYFIPVVVNVSNFVYDDVFQLKMLNSYTFDWTHWYYKDSSFVDSILPSHYELMFKNHMSPMHVFPNPEDTRPEIDEWLDLYKKGARAFILLYIGDPTYKSMKFEKYRSHLLSLIQLKENYLDSIGLLDYSYIFLFDEINKDRSHQLEYVAKFLKDNGVKSKLFTTASFPPSKDLIDAWCPLLQDYDGFEGHFISKEKEVFTERWAYTCNTTLGDEFGNVFTDLSHLEPRRIFWNIYERNLTHFQYYTINRWDKNLKYVSDISTKNKLLNRKERKINWVSASYRDQNGDGQLTYPADNGELWPSPRLFSYRDGIEDHQLFSQFEIKISNSDLRSKTRPLAIRDSLLRD